MLPKFDVIKFENIKADNFLIIIIKVIALKIRLILFFDLNIPTLGEKKCAT
tara:strand:+ start:513 stop:665 length:153 start_codon:yes stop_codon:yes gene_type:complete